MKHLLTVVSSVALAGLSVPSIGAEEEALIGKLVFPEGETLPGLAAGVSSEGFLLWKSELFVGDAIPFHTRNIDSILLRGTRPEQTQNTIATITFQSRVDNLFDVMRAELLGFNDTEVRLKTWYAGELTLKRTMVHGIEVTTEAPAILNGPGKPSDWQTIESPDAWAFEGKNLVSSARGSIARELSDLPDQVKMEFDLNFEYSPYLRLHFFANSGTDLIPRTGYSISIQRGSMQFLKKVDNRSIPLEIDLFGRRHDFQEEGLCRVELFIDRKEGDFTLYLDGAQISSAADPKPLTDENWWHLSTLHGREQTISNFAIRPWDGNLPERKEYLDFREELPVDGEQIELHNGDTIVGKATEIDQEGKLKIETEYVPVSIPLERLRSFQVTSQENREEPRLYREDVRAHFHHGGHVTLKLKEMTPTTITGYSQVFGDATFDLNAFSHIDFNPYDPEFRKRRGQPF